MKYFSISCKGDFRENNEDCFRNEEYEDSKIFLIADGMGGCLFGEEASEISVDEFLKCFKKHYSDDMSMKSLIYGSIHHAGFKVLEFSKKNNCENNVGTTFLAVVVKDDILYLFNIGDSRAYLYNEYGLHQISKDHIAKNCFLGNGITKALGFSDMDKPYGIIKDLDCGDKILMSTDGFYKYVEEKTIKEVLESNKNIEDKCKILVQEALKKSRDNITITLIEV